MLLIGGRANASTITEQLDSLRQVILKPKLEVYNNQIKEYTRSISQTTDKSLIKKYAKQIFALTRNLQSEIKELYGYSYKGVTNPIYVGTQITSPLYPVAGQFMFVTNYVSTGSLPDVDKQIEKIKDNAIYILLFSNSKIIHSSNNRIMKINKTFEG